MKKLKVGDRLLLSREGTNIRSDSQRWQEECDVAKVGRKYFTVKRGIHEVTFNISDWREKTQYCSNWRLYESKEEYADTKESARIMGKSSEFFGVYGNKRELSINDWRAIEKIISKYK